MRRLPIYICVDTSGSMREAIEALRSCVQVLISAMRQDPYALESVYLSIITYNTHAKEVLPPTPLMDVVVPTFTSGVASCLGAALECVVQAVRRDRIAANKAQRSDYKPILFIFINGIPSDPFVYNATVPIIKALEFTSIAVCVAGAKADVAVLKQLTDLVISLADAEARQIKDCIRWVSSSL